MKFRGGGWTRLSITSGLVVGVSRLWVDVKVACVCSPICECWRTAASETTGWAQAMECLPGAASAGDRKFVQLPKGKPDRTQGSQRSPRGLVWITNRQARLVLRRWCDLFGRSRALLIERFPHYRACVWHCGPRKTLKGARAQCFCAS